MAAVDADLPGLRELRAGVERLRSLATGRDPRTGAHERRVARVSVAIGRLLELPPIRLAVLDLAAGIHDFGKLQVPREILHKQGPLTDEERVIVRRHAQHGHDALALLRSTFPIAEIVQQHHERVDGRGYPRGLVGRDLHLESRILSVADVYDAMASARSYRPSLGAPDVTAELQRIRGTQLDEAAVDACLHLVATGEATRCLELP